MRRDTKRKNDTEDEKPTERDNDKKDKFRSMPREIYQNITTTRSSWSMREMYSEKGSVHRWRKGNEEEFSGKKSMTRSCLPFLFFSTAALFLSLKQIFLVSDPSADRFKCSLAPRTR